MRNLILILAVMVTSVASAQDLSVNIQETYHASLGLADEFHVYKVTNIAPTAVAWDEMNWEFSKMNFERMTSYGEHAMHTWTEAGVYVVFCTQDNIPLGERTFFVVNEKYVDFVKTNISGVAVDNTYVRSDIEWVGMDYDKVVIVR